MTELTLAVTRDDVIRFLNNGFRNIELPPLDAPDVEDIRQALADFARKSRPSDRPLGDDDVERVARAIAANNWVGSGYDQDQYVDRLWEDHVDDARAAISAMQDEGV